MAAIAGETILPPSAVTCYQDPLTGNMSLPPRHWLLFCRISNTSTMYNTANCCREGRTGARIYALIGGFGSQRILANCCVRMMIKTIVGEVIFVYSKQGNINKLASLEATLVGNSPE